MSARSPWSHLPKLRPSTPQCAMLWMRGTSAAFPLWNGSDVARTRRSRRHDADDRLLIYRVCAYRAQHDRRAKGPIAHRKPESVDRAARCHVAIIAGQVVIAGTARAGDAFEMRDARAGVIVGDDVPAHQSADVSVRALDVGEAACDGSVGVDPDTVC